MSKSVHTGRCLCGAVEIEARGEPYRIGVCHCLTCRQMHAMPFSLFAVFPPEAVSIEGDTVAFASSDKVRRYACTTCGSPVHASYGRDDEVYVYPGSFEETGLWQPTYELWTIRRDPWLPPFPSVVVRYERNRLKWSRTEG